MILPIQLPFKQRDFKFKMNLDGGLMIWDIIRKKYIAQTPEELVRQHLIHLFIHDFHYPQGRISVEKWMQIDRVRRRFDIVIYDPDMKPFMLIECKAPKVPLDEEVLFQILHYHQVMPSPYILISNGSYSFLAEIKDGIWNWKNKFPLYPTAEN